MIKLNWNSTVLFFLEAYIVVSFFAFRSMAIESVYLLTLLIIFLFGSSVTGKKIKIPKEFRICLILVTICLVLSFFFCKYDQLYTIGVFVCIFLLDTLEENNAFYNINKMKPDMFYICLVLALIVELFQSYQEGTYKVRTLMGDQNYTGILVFCIFMYSLKRKYISGFVLTALYAAVFNNSRGFISLFFVFAIFWGIKKPVYRILNWREKKQQNLFIIFMLFTAFTILLSFVWVYRISATSFTRVYKGSLNDASNRIRALSILRGLQMLNNPNETFLWGYGSKLLEVMGISGTDFASHPRFMGLRLAQPHNTAINLAVRIGIVPTVLYYYFLSKLISRYITEENIPYFVPFFLNSLFMHSLLIWQWLVLLVIILSMPQDKRRLKKWKLKREGTANKLSSISYHS